MHLADWLSLAVSGSSVIVAIVALAQTRKTNRAQQRVAVLLPRLQAYDSAVAIGRQLEHTTKIRFLAKVGSDEVEVVHAATGSTKPNHFATAYETYSQELRHQADLLEALSEQSYFPNDFSRAIRSLLAAAMVRNDVSAEVVDGQWKEIKANSQHLQAVHKDSTTLK
jgi:type II secretory pathway component PulF